MEQIIFHTNLKYIIAGLTREQKGLLLETLLDGAENGDLSFRTTRESGDIAEHGAVAFSAFDETVANIGRYIMLQQKDIAAKRQRMRDIGAKGGAARKRNSDTGEKDSGAGDVSDLFASGFSAETRAGTERAAGSSAETRAGTERASDSSADTRAGTERMAGFSAGNALSDDGIAGEFSNDAQAQLRHCCGKRKEAKENKNILNNKNNLFLGKQILMSALQRPTVAEVQAFVAAEGLNVDAATFVDFYDSHGWCVGRTAIKNWKATARLWHRRTCNETSGNYAGGKNVSQGVMRTAKNMADFDDEGYWSALEGRVVQGTENADAVAENVGEINTATGSKAFQGCEAATGSDLCTGSEVLKGCEAATGSVMAAEDR